MTKASKIKNRIRLTTILDLKKEGSEILIDVTIIGMGYLGISCAAFLAHLDGRRVKWTSEKIQKIRNFAFSEKIGIRI